MFVAVDFNRLCYNWFFVWFIKITCLKHFRPWKIRKRSVPFTASYKTTSRTAFSGRVSKHCNYARIQHTRVECIRVPIPASTSKRLKIYCIMVWHNKEWHIQLWKSAKSLENQWIKWSYPLSGKSHLKISVFHRTNFCQFPSKIFFLVNLNK